jgi:hypothetical protein
LTRTSHSFLDTLNIQSLILNLRFKKTQALNVCYSKSKERDYKMLALTALCNVLDKGVQQVAYVLLDKELRRKKISLLSTAVNIYKYIGLRDSVSTFTRLVRAQFFYFGRKFLGNAANENQLGSAPVMHGSWCTFLMWRLRLCWLHKVVEHTGHVASPKCTLKCLEHVCCVRNCLLHTLHS